MDLNLSAEELTELLVAFWTRYAPDKDLTGNKVSRVVDKYNTNQNELGNEMKKKYNIRNDSELPEISRFDPIAQAIGIKPKQVCEITRPSKTAIETKYYRKGQF